MSENNAKELLTKPFDVTIIVTPEEILNELVDICECAASAHDYSITVSCILDVLVKYRLLNPDGYNVAFSIDAAINEKIEEKIIY